MNVVFILTYYHPHWTGLTQYAKRVAEGLAENGHNVKVITTQHQKSLPVKETINKVEVIREKTILRVSRSLLSISFITNQWKHVKAADRVIVFLPLAEVLITTIFCKLLNKKLILVHNGDLVLPRGFINMVLEKIYFITSSIAIAYSKYVIIHTIDYAKNSLLLKKFTNKWKVILPPIAKMKPKSEIMTKIKDQFNGGKFVIGFAGRFVEEKGFDILMSAIPEIVRQLPKTVFVYAGETNVSYENFFTRNKKLFEQVSPHIQMTGLLSLEDMASFYGVCDVFVVSSRTDCFPVTQIESMLSGTPVVVTNIPGARWPVMQTNMGVVVDSVNPKALASGIVEVLKNKRNYVKPIKEINKIFDYQKSIQDYESALR